MSRHGLHRFRQTALAVGVLALLAAAVIGRQHVAVLLAGCRFAVFACLAPCLGSLIFVLIYRLTGGQWAERLLPFLARGIAVLPWVWLLLLPLLWLQRDAFHGSPEATGLVRAYFSHSALVGRSLGYAVGFFAYAMLARRSVARVEALRWFGPVGLIGLVFMLHFLAVDWFVALEPGWYSTGFGLVWTTSQAVAGLAAAIVAALASGADPAQAGGAKRSRGLDWGNLLLAAVLSWTYVAFVQFLIIWSGNLPREIEWYVHRGYGGWRVVLLALVVLQFVVPLAVLLSRDAKRRAVWLGGLATLVVLGQVAYTAWLILPAFSIESGLPRWSVLGIGGGAFALLAALYLGVAADRSAAVEDAR